MKSTLINRNRRGTALIEFMLLGVPIVFLTFSVFEVSLAMWEYATMAATVQAGAQYVSVHGNTCTQNGNNCTVTVATIASYIQGVAVGLPSSALNITLYSTNSTVSCTPLSSCSSNSTVFPPTGDNAVGSDVRVQATYAMNNPIAMFWPSHALVNIGTMTLGATSTQRIIF